MHGGLWVGEWDSLIAMQPAFIKNRALRSGPHVGFGPSQLAAIGTDQPAVVAVLPATLDEIGEIVAFLIVHEAGQPDRLFEAPLSHIVIGRGTDVDLVLPNVSVSREHARIDIQADSSALLRNLADDNVLLIGDEEVRTPRVVESGTRFRLGKYRLTYLHASSLDLYQVQRLSDMPRFTSRAANNAETHVMSAALQRRLLEIEVRREFGALVDSSGQSHLLGAESVAVGPSAAIPCPSRWGARTAATVTWAGAQHKVEKASMFAKVLVNGTAFDERMLELGDTVEINGAQFVYQAERRRKRRK